MYYGIRVNGLYGPDDSVAARHPVPWMVSPPCSPSLDVPMAAEQVHPGAHAHMRQMRSVLLPAFRNVVRWMSNQLAAHYHFGPLNVSLLHLNNAKNPGAFTPPPVFSPHARVRFPSPLLDHNTSTADLSHHLGFGPPFLPSPRPLGGDRESVLGVRPEDVAAWLCWAVPPRVALALILAFPSLSPCPSSPWLLGPRNYHIAFFLRFHAPRPTAPPPPSSTHPSSTSSFYRRGARSQLYEEKGPGILSLIAWSVKPSMASGKSAQVSWPYRATRSGALRVLERTGSVASDIIVQDEHGTQPGTNFLIVPQARNSVSLRPL
ncbi:hypothetical protein DFH09DRAFT_1370108 [Mycena vulgaris]|nr:hypothetical protein DFH09DRAFT_1370108 [Mycena vulgaris]